MGTHSGHGHQPGRLAPEFVEALFESKPRWHAAQAQSPLQEKVRILLEMQRQHLPVIARRRALQPWEKPWDVEP